MLSMFIRDPIRILPRPAMSVLLGATLKEMSSTKRNILRLLAYPIVKLRPSLRQLIVAVAIKAREPIIRAQEIWG